MIMTITAEKASPTFDYLKVDTLQFGDLREYVSSQVSTMNLRELDDNGWQLVSKKEQQVLTQAAKRSISLGDYTNSEILYGIKTGLTKAFVIDALAKEELVASDNRSAEILKPFLMGKDIQRYDTPDIDKYLVFFPKGFTSEQSGLTDEAQAWQWIQSNYPAVASWLAPFETKAKKRYDQGEFWWELRACDYYNAFEEPKIIYLKFQVKPAFIMDLQKSYNNDANFIYPHEDYFLLGILNSKLGWFLISNTCTEIQNGYQLIYDYFKNIPIPAHPSDEIKTDIENLVKKIIHLKQIMNTKKQKFLKRLQSNFEIEKLSKKLENFYELDFKTFLKELKKKKVTLSLKEQDEWEEYFESYQKELLDLQTKIEKTDREIDQMVYALYGLSEEEIRIVEGE